MSIVSHLPRPCWEPHVRNESVNLVVVGGGIAGLTAALRSAELGRSVVVLEQGRQQDYPCNSRFSGGILHAAHLDVNRPADELLAAIDKASFATADRDLARAVAEDGRRLLAWLRGNGVRFMRFSSAEAHRWGMAPPRPIAPGLDWRGRGPDAMLRGLTAKLVEKGGRIIRGARAAALHRTNRGVSGLDFEQDGMRHGLKAQGVLLADGGFQADAEFFRAYIGPSPERILQRGAATGRGDGVRMALTAGAATDRMDRFYGHLHHRDALHDPRLWPYPELDAIAAAGIVVGPQGRRITDEGQGGIAIANALARRDDPADAVAIFDQAIWEGPGRTARLPANPFLERFGGIVRRAGALEKLAGMIGLPPQALSATVARYNQSLADGRLRDLVPPRSATKAAPKPIVGPEFCAVPLCVGITYTMGGIVIDGHGRVLQADGTSIHGLYAAGATTTGLEGGGEEGVGYVGGLIKAVFGLRAAEDAAARADADSVPA